VRPLRVSWLDFLPDAPHQQVGVAGKSTLA
jgi:hypothetical protein